MKSPALGQTQSRGRERHLESSRKGWKWFWMLAAKPVSQDGREGPEVCLDVKTEGSTHLKEA